METDRDVHQRRVISESALHVIKLFQGTYILPLSRYRLRRNNNVHLNWTMNVTFIPFLMFALLFLSLLVVTQIRGHIAASSPPFPLRFVPCIFIARRFQLFLPSLVDERGTRVEL